MIGVCLPIPVLRRLMNQPATDDYELHCTAVAEAVQRELDRRFVLPLRRSSAAKSHEALSAWWDDASQGPDLAGAFWATLTHARCSA